MIDLDFLSLNKATAKKLTTSAMAYSLTVIILSELSKILDFSNVNIDNDVVIKIYHIHKRGIKKVTKDGKNYYKNE